MKYFILFFLVCCLAFKVNISLADGATKIPASRDEISLSFAPIVKKVAPGVVNIYAQKTVKARKNLPGIFGDPFFRNFFKNFAFPQGQIQEQIKNSLGSGVIVNKDGIVVTNHHVISGADAIQAVLSNGRRYDADILIADARSDIAVLKLKNIRNDLPHVNFGDADKLQVGDLVIAIGNPFGVGQTVTSGIISGLARTAKGVSDIESFIQTDAAINPGNSGGALVDMQGNVIGINTAIFTRSGGSIGIGFAVPENMVQKVLKNALDGTPLISPYMGFASKNLNWDISDALNLANTKGVIVEHIYNDSPAEWAKLRAGDIITHIDDWPINNIQELAFRMTIAPIDSSVSLTILRKGKEIKLPFKLVLPPETPLRDTQEITQDSPLKNAIVVNLSPLLASELSIDTTREQAKGVYILNFTDPGLAYRAGFRKADIILSVNGVDIKTVKDLIRQLENQDTTQWNIEVKRNGKIQKLVFVLNE